MHYNQKYFRTTLSACLFLAHFSAQANPIACFDTNMGNFCIELFETQTPVTTANFLSYINNGAYTHGIFHRSVPDFVVQGGGFQIVDSADGKSLNPVTVLPPIINEYKISNARGTVAMAKLGNNPNSATSQWFVNLADNNDPRNPQNLDIQNGGFTVFGRVLFDGMSVFDAIEKLPIRNLGGSLSATPLKDFDGTQAASFNNLVQINHVAVTTTVGVFSEGTLSFPVDIGTGTALAVNLRLIKDNPSIVFELDLTSVTSLASNPASIATFSSQNSQLHIPSVMINTSTQINNVVMSLTNAESYQFTLLSFDSIN